MDGAPAARNALRVDSGATLALNRAASLFANVNTEHSNRGRAYAAIGDARFNW